MSGDAEWPMPASRRTEYGTENSGRNWTHTPRCHQARALF